MAKPVNTKMDFVRRYEAGEFGNRAPTWGSYEEWCQSTSPKTGNLYHIRNREAGGLTYYNLSPREVGRKWRQLASASNYHELYISQMAPTDRTVIQGEVYRTAHRSPYLRYTTVVAPMRVALAKEERHAAGLLAYTLLHYYLCPVSFEWLTYLLDEYIGHVVEFSVYSMNWGTIPGYNTVFWEVRNY